MILELTIMIVVFLLCNWVGWLLTEKYTMPKFLQYKPFSCRLCFTWWLTIFAAICIVLTLGFKVTSIGLAILAVLNVIAMWIDKRQKTVEDINTYQIEEK